MNEWTFYLSLSSTSSDALAYKAGPWTQITPKVTQAWLGVMKRNGPGARNFFCQFKG